MQELFDLVEYSKAGKRRVRKVPAGGHGHPGRRAGHPGHAPRIHVPRPHAVHRPRGPQSRGRQQPATWLTDAINKTVQSGDIACSLTESCEIVLINNATTKHIYANKGAFLAALYAACQGSLAKVVGAAAGAGAALTPIGVSLAADAFGGVFAAGVPGTVVSGFRVRFSASVTNNSYRPVQIDLGTIVGAGGLQTVPTPVTSFILYPRTPAVDAVFWAVSVNRGLAALTPGVIGAGVQNGTSTAQQGIVARTQDATSFVEFESINLGDLYPRFGACPPSPQAALAAPASDGDADAICADFGYDGNDLYDEDSMGQGRGWAQGWNRNRAFQNLRDEASD